MFSYTIPCFDLGQIALSGQCFRMNRLPSGGYSVISGQHYLEIFQDSADIVQNTAQNTTPNMAQVFFDCPKEDLPFWKHYFDLETDYSKYLAAIDPNDSYLLAAGAAGRGIRILYQDLWEMVLTFILSQQKTIPKIKEAVELLCERYGTRLTAENGTSFYTFPTAKQLTTATVEDLLELKLGYRAKYIERAARDVRTGNLDLKCLSGMPYEDALPYLMQFYGIGEKVANCVCLFGLHQIDAFPIDTWIQRILLREYYRPEYDSLPKSHLYHQMIQDSFGKYQGYAGVMQQYIFFYERMK